MWSYSCPFPSPYLRSFCHCFYEEAPRSLSLFIFLNFHNAYVGVPIATYAFPLIFTLCLFLIPSVEQFNAFLPEPAHSFCQVLHFRCCILELKISSPVLFRYFCIFLSVMNLFMVVILPFILLCSSYNTVYFLFLTVDF